MQVNKMFNKYKYLALIVILTLIVAFADVLPSHYDLRNVGGIPYVSFVRSQQGGTCWTHGTMAAIESNMMKTGLWDAAEYFSGPDLSEYHLDWWNGFNRFYNQDIGYYPYEGLAVHMGGDYRVATAYLSRGDGAVLNEDAPSYKSAAPRRDTSYTYYYPRTVQWFQLKDDLSNIDLIKQKIMDHGAVGTCMYANDIFLDDSTNGSFYQPPSDLRDPNHSIAIVGWNDYHGWRDTLDVTEAANVFVAEARDTLVAISFFAAGDSVEYTVGVFRNRHDLVNEDPVTTQSGIVSYAGFYTVDLDDKVVLMEGDSFYVYLYLDKGGQPYDRTSVVPVLLDVPSIYRTALPALTSVPSTASPNESFFKQNERWLDLQTVNTTANFCIKALVKKGKFSLQQPLPESSSLLGIYPNPSNSRIIVDFQLSHTAVVEINLFDLRGRRVGELADKTLPEGYRWFEFDLSDLSSGIYICIFKVDGVRLNTEKVLIVK